jgi:hypothetical protein
MHHRLPSEPATGKRDRQRDGVVERVPDRRHRPWGEWFAGAMDDVRVYNRGLTGGEIVADMNTAVG